MTAEEEAMVAELRDYIDKLETMLWQRDREYEELSRAISMRGPEPLRTPIVCRADDQ